MFGDICYVYPPKVKDVIADPMFAFYEKIMLQSKEDLEDADAEQEKKLEQQAKEKGLPYQKDENRKIPTPLEYILINSYYNQNIRLIVEGAFKFFTKEEIVLDYENKAIIIQGSQKTLNEENFLKFQNFLRRSLGKEEIEEEKEEDLSKLNPIVRRVREASRRRRRIVKKTKSSQNGISLTTYLASICCMGVGITPLNIGEISYASLFTIVEVYQQKEKYESDFQSILAGADPKKVKMKYWIRENSDNLQEIKI